MSFNRPVHFTQALPMYLKTRANMGTDRKPRNTNSIGLFGLVHPPTKFRKSAFLRMGLRFLVSRRGQCCTFFAACQRRSKVAPGGAQIRRRGEIARLHGVSPTCHRTSSFRISASDFFRPSDFGLWISELPDSPHSQPGLEATLSVSCFRLASKGPL